MTFDLFTVRSNLRSRNWENIDRSFPLDIVKANGGNLQCMIEAVKRFNKNNKKKTFRVLYTLVPGLYTSMKYCYLYKR